jgi:hypothetical protein
MTTTTTTARPRGARQLSLAWIAPALLAVAALVIVVMLSMGSPGRDSVTFVNRTGAPVTLSVTGGDGGGWLGLGTIDPNSRSKIEAVIDQGAVWRFDLSVGPDHIGEIQRTEDQLRAAGWKVTIPKDAVDHLDEPRRSL